MAEALNWILNDSQQAAKAYSKLVDASNVDSKMWDFAEMAKDHDQIVGHVKRTLAQIGATPEEKTRSIWPQVEKDKAARVYEDIETLQALRDAEQAALEDCEKLMSMSNNNRMVHTFVSTNVMPVINSHIETLDRYIERAHARR
jgi:thiamine pyrophosphate-dependent acetolactate synthase large subunit-like protein